MASFDIIAYVISSLLLLSQHTSVVCVDPDHLAEDDDADSVADMCKSFAGDYVKEYEGSFICCANETLQLPNDLFGDNFPKKIYQDCSKKFKSDLKSDFPTGMWNAFLCELKALSTFKSSQITFEEVMNKISKLYPDKIKAELKKQTAKCKAIDSEKVGDDLKIQKIMACYTEAEYKVCHKPTKNAETDADYEEELKTMKKLGCPVTHGFESPIEYCCKGRSTPYRIADFPESRESPQEDKATKNCQLSFGKREKELMPETFNVVTPETEDGEDHEIHTTWDVLCREACSMAQKNYTKEILKLDFEAAAEYFTHDFPNNTKTEILKILKRRKNKEKIFHAMDVDTENAKPMNYQELSAKFKKADEKQKIEYYCKFVDTVGFEERRALHEYCFDEKYGNEWGNDHHPFFAGA